MSIIDEDARKWWYELSENGRWSLVTSLYRVSCVSQQERDVVDNSGEGEDSHATAAKESVERLTQILEAGESRWEKRFMEMQRAANERARASAENDAQMRNTLALIQNENSRLRQRLEESESDRVERAREEAHSADKGRRYEDEMAKIIQEAFPMAVYTNTSGSPHAGDGLLFAPDFGIHKCMFEFKCHTHPVREAEVTKLARDLDGSRASFAIMTTRSVNVAGRRDFDVERTPGEGKPILFLLRTNDCSSAVPALLRQAVRFLNRLVNDSAANRVVDMAALTVRFTRTARTLRAAITKFDQQWVAMRNTITESIDDLKTCVSPDICLDSLRTTLAVFDERTELVAVDEILQVVRNRYPNTTKRKLVRLLRQVGDDCCTVRVIRPGHPQWDNLCGKTATTKSVTYVSFCV